MAMELKITANTIVELVPMHELSAKLRWDILRGYIDLLPDSCTKNYKLVGSYEYATDGHDTLLFDGESGALVTAVLRIPEDVLDTKPSYFDNQITSLRGALVMNSPHDFNLEFSSVRWFDNATCKLFAFYEYEHADIVPDLQVEIASNLSLLFSRQLLLGWVITDPARYLCGAGELPDSDKPTENIRRLVGEYFNLVTTENVDLMYDRVPSIKLRLEELLAGAQSEKSDKQRSTALLVRIEQILDTFYQA
jgi:hypothetical protein